MSNTKKTIKMETKNTQMIDFESLKSKNYQKNVENIGGEFSDTCICCGKRTATKILIHLTTCGMVVPNNVDENDLIKLEMESQGCFPIGSECAKKLNSKYKYFLM